MLRVVIAPVGQITPIGFPLWEIVTSGTGQEVVYDIAAYTFDNITPGVYVFGEAPLVGIPAYFKDVPFVHVRNENDGEHFINATSTGFTLTDKGQGNVPSVGITIIENKHESIPIIPYVESEVETNFIPVDVPNFVSKVIRRREIPENGMTNEVVYDITGYTFSGLTPGAYVFGTSPLTGMPAEFPNVPFIHILNNNDGSHYIENQSESGFILRDKGEGNIPSVTVTIIENK